MGNQINKITENFISGNILYASQLNRLIQQENDIIDYIDENFIKNDSSCEKSGDFQDSTEQTENYAETIKNTVKIDLAEDNSDLFKEPSVAVCTVQTTGGKDFVRKQEAILTPTKINGIRINDLVTKETIEEYYKNDEIDYMLTALEERLNAKIAELESRLSGTNNN